MVHPARIARIVRIVPTGRQACRACLALRDKERVKVLRRLLCKEKPKFAAGVAFGRASQKQKNTICGAFAVRFPWELVLLALEEASQQPAIPWRDFQLL